MIDLMPKLRAKLPRPERVASRYGRRLSLEAQGRCRAFTLIEMMVVLVLIGIISAMILPEMKGTYGDALLRSSARDLINVFSIAGSRAISLNQLHLVRINAVTGHYEIERQVQNPGKRADFAPLQDVSDSSGKLDERISVKVRKTNETEPGRTSAEQTAAPGDDPDTSVPPGAIAFYPDGTAEAATVVLHDRAGFGLRLRISPITARVQIQALSPEQSDEADETTDEHGAAERQSDEKPHLTPDEQR